MLAEQPVHFEHLSDSQRQAVATILDSRDQITGLQGAAGTGKTTSLAAIREAAEREGYQVEGFAPTSRAAYQLEEAGIPATIRWRWRARRISLKKPGSERPRCSIIWRRASACTTE